MGRLQLLEQSNPVAVASHGILSVNSTNKKLTHTTAAGVAETLGPLTNANTAQLTGFATDTQVAGSVIAIPPGLLRVGSTYRCKFDITKTAAGTATPIITVRIGTAGTIADTARLTFTFSAGTAAVDVGSFEIVFTVRVAGASCIIAGSCELKHQLAATGLTSGGTGGLELKAGASSAFDATVASSIISIGYNGGTSHAATIECVTSQLLAA